jgi:GNAT superfamily N-acetyltransferase
MCPLSAATEKIVASIPDGPSAFSQRVGDVLGDRCSAHVCLSAPTEKRRHDPKPDGPCGVLAANRASVVANRCARSEKAGAVESWAVMAGNSGKEGLGCCFPAETAGLTSAVAFRRWYHRKVIRQIDRADLDLFMPHAELHAKESGNGTTVRFGLRGSSDPFERDRIRRFLDSGLSVGVGSSGWCRVWVDEGPSEIRGHVGLRAHALAESKHRALVSVGVLEPYRRQGVAEKLLNAAIIWARSQEALIWLDSEVFGHNEPALRLHQKVGFAEVARLTDMFRIAGAKVDDVRLTLPLRHA